MFVSITCRMVNEGNHTILYMGYFLRYKRLQWRSTEYKIGHLVRYINLIAKPNKGFVKKVA